MCFNLLFASVIFTAFVCFIALCVLFVFCIAFVDSVLQMIDTAYRPLEYAVFISFCQYGILTLRMHIRRIIPDDTAYRHLRHPIRRIPSMDTAYGPPETECKKNFILSLACLRYIFIKEHKLLIALLWFQICMTRRSKLKLVQPHEDPEKLFRSNRKLIKTTSLDSSSPLQLELLEQIEDQLNIEEEVANMATPTMEEYMTTTRNGYGPSVVRPNVDKDKNFKIKG